jgi:hypothetical protein
MPLEGVPADEWVVFERALIVRDLFTGGTRTFTSSQDARAFRAEVYRQYGRCLAVYMSDPCTAAAVPAAAALLNHQAAGLPPPAASLTSLLLQPMRLNKHNINNMCYHRPCCVRAGLPPPAARRRVPRLITFQRKRANRRIVNEEGLLALLAQYGQLRVVEFNSSTSFAGEPQLHRSERLCKQNRSCLSRVTAAAMCCGPTAAVSHASFMSAVQSLAQYGQLRVLEFNSSTSFAGEGAASQTEPQLSVRI